MEQSQIAGLVALAAGAFGVTAAALDWDFFMQSRKARAWVSRIGRNNARLMYGGIGLFVALFGLFLVIVAPGGGDAAQDVAVSGPTGNDGGRLPVAPGRADANRNPGSSAPAPSMGNSGFDGGNKTDSGGVPDRSAATDRPKRSSSSPFPDAPPTRPFPGAPPASTSNGESPGPGSGTSSNNSRFQFGADSSPASDPSPTAGRPQSPTQANADVRAGSVGQAASNGNRPNVAPSRSSSSLPPGTMDLLARIEPARDQVQGDWTLEDGALIAPKARPAILEIPIEPPERYVLTAMVEELEGRESFSLGLMVGGHGVTVVLAGAQGKDSGLNLLDGRIARGDSISQISGPVLEAGENEIVATVVPDRFRIQCNGRTVIDWQGDPSRLSYGYEWKKGSTDRLKVGSWSNRCRISRLTLKRL